MTPIRTALDLAWIAVLLATFGHLALAIALGLLAVLLAGFILRVVRRHRRVRRARVVDVADEARARDAGDGRAIRDAQAAWMREQASVTSESVVRTVQLARAEILRTGAPEARAVLDELEREAREHPEGLPGHVVAAVRMRFDELMRANIQ